MLRGNLPAVADAAMRGGSGALTAFRLDVGCALAPMLAETAGSVEAALADLDAPAAFEPKLDGARIQIHKRGTEVHLFTRSLDDVTARLGHIAADVARWPVPTLVADGEILWFAFAGDDRDARPLPFQETASRFARNKSDDRRPKRSGQRSFCSICSVDGVDLLDRPKASVVQRSRSRHLRELVDRIVTADRVKVRRFSSE